MAVNGASIGIIVSMTIIPVSGMKMKGLNRKSEYLYQKR
eukprot:CAMPEP_0194333202 /NCGR_PEP_ID=MMETSP0171-20130528/61927_1 /TAXON_ID=218684 /ORGANISM="Corethron pennatum, Strain L29A3" /LENGTH=38 /DNA_ID= /DNA_START= /DNA_END= /DNA_ORIENTATION=